MGTRYQSLPRSINFSSTTLLSVPRLNSTGGGGGEINFNTSPFDDARTVREYYYYQLGRAAMLFPKFPRRRQSHPPPHPRVIFLRFSTSTPNEGKEIADEMVVSMRTFLLWGGKLRLKGWVLSFPWWRRECNLVASDKSFA